MKNSKKTQDSSEVPWSEFSAKLDTLIRLSALNVVKDLKTQKEQIATLSDAGFGPSDIADILRTTSNTVNVALSAIRKERGLGKAEEQKKETPTEESVELPAETQTDTKDKALQT
ncbi:MAG: hypothetical protein M1587_08950 [Thaumarchaeota archaeon]|nr:hypothetical protein [Nitrososphaerota archaeon]